MSFEQVKGHDAQVRLFDQAVRRGRLGHAYLFVGPPGIGKRFFGRELAKSLLCDAPPDGRLDSCAHCPSCVQVDAGTHPDFFATGRPPESLELPIEVVRELCGNFALKSARGRGKVVLLDDADDLNEEAANCFLKTLEEPPPRSLLLLIGTSQERQLATIVSRCQVVRFAPLPTALVDDLLQAQGVADPELRQLLVQVADGSPGQALTLSDPALWSFRRTLIDALTHSRPNCVVLAKEWSHFVEEAGKEAAAQRRRAALVLKLLIDFLRGVLRHQVGASHQLTDPRDVRALEDLAKRADPDKLLSLIDRCLEGDWHIDRRVQLVLALESLVDALGQRLA